MAAFILCMDCLPEGSSLGFADLVAGPPKHCQGKNDRTTPGVMGGVVCPCSCNRKGTE